tara:strand:+ start:649 stop:1188 length:540 start_codon:yes stop_codon:yes gene_type:complete
MIDMSNILKVIITLIMVFLSASSGIAQENKLINLETLLNSNEGAQKISLKKTQLNKRNTSNSINIQMIESLVYEVSPTVYIQNNNVEHFEDAAPVLASMEDDSYRLIYTKNSLFEKVEMVKFRYNMNTRWNIDVSQMTSFSNLKYFLIECEFDCTEKELAALFSNAEGITIIYTIIQSE